MTVTRFPDLTKDDINKKVMAKLRVSNTYSPSVLQKFTWGGGGFSLPLNISAAIHSIGTMHMFLGQFFKQNSNIKFTEP